MTRPLLGVTACNRVIEDEGVATVMHRYIEAAAHYADAMVVLLPSMPDLQVADEMAARVDGVLLTGSPSNVETYRYGDSDPGEGPFDPGRDATALGLIQSMARRGRPVFGVCRGFQEVNVAFGGTLRRDLAHPSRALVHHAPDDPEIEAFDWGHPVTLTPGGVLFEALGVPALPVNSVHYQGVAGLAPGLEVEAVAPDGLVEAVSADLGGADLLAVQWHPEWRTDETQASQLFFRLLGRALRGERLRRGEPLRRAVGDGR